MKHLIDKEKFLAEVKKASTIWSGHDDNSNLMEIEIPIFEGILSKHTKKMVDEPHFPSGMDKHDIDVRNDLREELRNG